MCFGIYNVQNLFLPFGRGGFVKAWEEKDELLNQLMNDGGVCRAAPCFARACLILVSALDLHLARLLQLKRLKLIFASILKYK